ncbi:unnamed protein product [Hymenolepis diminuta]|uniref:Uncharacterized protein n=1 Tax=Hymenolepis diminuta TaxID=6216 RepID=A0A564Y6N2_HYMDI|nr:unnamed protein product [Hymenolepis diminuta]
MMERKEQIYTGQHLPNQAKYNQRENELKNINSKIEVSREMSDEGYHSDGCVFLI